MEQQQQQPPPFPVIVSEVVINRQTEADFVLRVKPLSLKMVTFVNNNNDNNSSSLLGSLEGSSSFPGILSRIDTLKHEGKIRLLEAGPLPPRRLLDLNVPTTQPQMDSEINDDDDDDEEWVTLTEADKNDNLFEENDNLFEDVD
jgi:hypothetical protein